jgi:hypothetical protein
MKSVESQQRHRLRNEAQSIENIEVVLTERPFEGEYKRSKPFLHPEFGISASLPKLAGLFRAEVS